MLFLFSLLLMLTGCSLKAYVRTGDAPICLIIYEAKIIDCSYNTMQDCQDRYSNNSASLCVPRKDLK